MKVNDPVKIDIDYSGINMNILVPINKEGFKGIINVQLFASNEYNIDLDYIDDNLMFLGKPLPNSYKEKQEWVKHYRGMFDKSYTEVLWEEVKSILTINKLKEIIKKEWGENVVKNIKWELSN